MKDGKRGLGIRTKTWKVKAGIETCKKERKLENGDLKNRVKFRNEEKVKRDGNLSRDILNKVKINLK